MPAAASAAAAMIRAGRPNMIPCLPVCVLVFQTRSAPGRLTGAACDYPGPARWSHSPDPGQLAGQLRAGVADHVVDRPAVVAAVLGRPQAEPDPVAPDLPPPVLVAHP